MDISERSAWREIQKPFSFPSFASGAKVDVAIIGGGFTGLLAAYRLREAGLKIALLEKEEIGSWASGSTTAFLMEKLDTETKALIDQHGFESAKRIITAHRDAITFYETIITNEKIACDFSRCPAYILASDSKDVQELKQEEESARQTGMDAHFIEGVPLPFAIAGALKIQSQAKLHPLKFLYSLAQLCSSKGVGIYEHSEVTSLTTEANGVRLSTEKGTLTATRVLMATHYPLNPQPDQLRFKKAWYTTYVIQANIRKGLMPNALFEDLENPYHYFRVDSGTENDYLIIGGEDHRSDINFHAEKAYERLEEYMEKLLQNEKLTITNKWRGRIVEPGDGLAYIGPLGENVFYATGYSGTGLTYAAIASVMFEAFCLGKTIPYSEFYADRPFELRAHADKAKDYIEELLNGLLDRFSN